MDIDRARRDKALLSPDGLEQLIAAVGAAGMGQKKFEQVEFGGGEFELSRRAGKSGARCGPGERDRSPIGGGLVSNSSRRRCAFTRAISSRGLNGLVM